MCSNKKYKPMDEKLKTNGILTRPNASNGLWLSLLIPFCYFVNITQHWQAVPFDYKISTIASFGLLLNCIITLTLLSRVVDKKSITVLTNILPGAITSFLIWICLKQGIVFSLLSGTLLIVAYSWIFKQLLQKMPGCFTLGEASIVCQGLVLFLFNCYIHLPYAWQNNQLPQAEVFKAILQVGLLGIGSLTLAVYYVKFLRWTFLFYIFMVAVIIFVVLFPLTGQIPILVLTEFIIRDLERIAIVCMYMLLLGVSAATVSWQIQKNNRSLSIVRKVFHILIVLVYVPGLVYQCTLLYLASLIVLAIFILLETMRLINLYPVASTLNTAVKAFLDEKDAGGIALTPIYLLIGCSAPMWLHPSPCDLTDSAGFNLFYLLAGILSVGIGDTAAGIVGTKFGMHKWPHTQKSVEGTLASIASQILMLFLLHSLKVLQMNSPKVATAGAGIIINALVESKTDQVDNLILPLLTFIIFSIAL